ncbi:MAG: hypothetical protein DMF63_16305 [Acidobacteria bacterium]|nr:MAG: hypothetical protein DMF63_16305 [Acidobacteriota bacterium]
MSEDVSVTTNVHRMTATREPLFRLTSRRRWYDLELKEIVDRRDLLWLLILKRIRLKYRQTLLGVLWTIIQPLAPMLVFSLVFTNFFSGSIGTMAYPVFVLAGLVPWLYFSNAVNAGGDSLTSQSYLLGRVYFPRFMLPLSVVLSGVPDLLIGCAVLSIVLLVAGMSIYSTLLWVPLLLLLLIWLALSIGALFASLTIVYRDIRNVVPYFLQLLLFLTPIVYPPEAIPEKWSWLIKINPLTGIINSFRAVLLGESPIWSDIAASVGITSITCIVAVMTFVKMERHVAD